MSKSITGTMKECLAHFGRIRTPDDFQRLAEFTGASYECTVLDWVKGKHMPVGEYLVRTQVFLANEGYRVNEFEVLSVDLQTACRLLAHNILTLSDIANMFQFTTKSAKDLMLRVFRGKSGISTARVSHAREFLDAFRDELTKKEAKIQGNGVATDEKTVPTAVESSQDAIPTVAVPPAVQPQARDARIATAMRDEMIGKAAALVRVLLPLLHFLESGRCTAEDRQKLRDATDSDLIFKLANVSYNLCGERARKHHRTTASSKEQQQ